MNNSNENIVEPFMVCGNFEIWVRFTVRNEETFDRNFVERKLTSEEITSNHIEYVYDYGNYYIEHCELFLKYTNYNVLESEV